MEKSGEKFEYRVIGWRNFEKEQVRKQLDDLFDDGWELDGPEYIKAGMLVDMTNQRLRRKRP